jgi:hypothetical protein
MLVPVTKMKSWLAAFDEEAAAYYPDRIEHVSQSGDEIRAMLAATPAAVQPCAHSWHDFGSLGGRNVSWCGKCDALAFTGNESAAVQQGREALPTEAESNECNASWAHYVMNLNGAPTTTSEVYRAAWFMSRAALAPTPQAPTVNWKNSDLDPTWGGPTSYPKG